MTRKPPIEISNLIILLITVNIHSSTQTKKMLVPLTNGFPDTISTPSSFTQASLLAQRRKIVGKGNTYFFRMDASTEMILGRQFFAVNNIKP